MEITLEKIELVKDRTGVSYKEAKEALEAAGGSVVDAIISIEETIDAKGKGKFSDSTSAVIDKLKEIVRKGNVSKILIKKNDELILNLPLNVGIVGAVIAPFAMIAGVIAALGTRCKVEVVKEDGSIIDVSSMASDAAEYAVEKGSEIAEEVKVRSADIYETVKEKSTDAYEAVKDKAAGAMKREGKYSGYGDYEDGSYYDDGACSFCDEEDCENCDAAEKKE
ncbi:MAG: DUF4342 domain-containing protein [Firmicutes bacterium]|nr:DUF4342 domain-containing protein [Bacillota bacterium]